MTAASASAETDVCVCVHAFARVVRRCLPDKLPFTMLVAVFVFDYRIVVVAGLRLWKTLPEDITSAPSILCFGEN